MARKKVKKVTVSELQSYIKGAIEFNEENWHPDKKQWDKIVEMIMNIKEEPPIQVVRNSNNQTVQNAQGNQNNPPAQSGSILEEAKPAEAVDQLHNDPSANPNYVPPPKTDMRRITVEKSGDVTRDPNTNVLSSGNKVKTPNVDTSEQDYESSFL